MILNSSMDHIYLQRHSSLVRKYTEYATELKKIHNYHVSSLLHTKCLTPENKRALQKE